MSSPLLIAKVALINDEGKLLVLTRSATAPNRPNEADIPGGKIEPGEAFVTAAVREIQEETGLHMQAADLKLVYTHTDYRDGEAMIRFLYAGKFPQGQTPVLSYEHSDWQWMSFDEVKAHYSHNIWVNGIAFANEHNLLPATIV